VTPQQLESLIVNVQHAESVKPARSPVIQAKVATTEASDGFAMPIIRTSP
jgi:hypothetical protein